jgi:hypothetical protein
MTTFNRLLEANGIDPSDVALLRHQTTRRGRTPYWLWENDRASFLRYQSTQQGLPIFRQPYWASFVSPAKHLTVFVGLFEVAMRPEVDIDWRDPLDGGPVGGTKNKPYFYYECRLIPALAAHIGQLHIDWGQSLRQWTQYAAKHDKAVTTRLSRPIRHRPSFTAEHVDGLERTFGLLGYARLHRTQKLTMLQDADGVIVYLKNETFHCPIVIHPYYDVIRAQLETLPGIALDPERAFYINSNLSAFPRYQAPQRTTTSRYGIALDAHDAASIGRLAALLRDNRTIHTPLGPVAFDEREPRGGLTQREQLGLARIGQGQFRLDCNQLWKWRCALSGVAIPELLRASHIKAWHEASDAERLDPYNGLLLAAHVDALFDRHLIGFADDGHLLYSSRIKASDLWAIGIDPEVARVDGLHARHRVYLAHHRRRLIR